MDIFQKISLVGLRVALGWLMFYAGITKVLNPEWSAAGFLGNAKTFSNFYTWFAQPEILPVTNFLNEWGLTVIGAMLILGLGVRVASMIGVAFMALYYFPALQFPLVPPHSYIVDQHVVYALAFMILAAFKAGRVWGLERWCAGLPICSRYPAIRKLVG